MAQHDSTTDVTVATEEYVCVQIDPASGACTLQVVTSPLTSPREGDAAAVAKGTPAPLSPGLSIPTAAEVQAADAEDMHAAGGGAEFQVLPTPPGLNQGTAAGMIVY